MTYLKSAAAFVAALAVTQFAPNLAAADEIVVQGTSVSIPQWQKRVGAALANRMEYPTFDRWDGLDQGVVRVGFRCSEDGKTSEVFLVRSSGSKKLDKSGLRAVSGLKTLHPMPGAFGNGQTFQANLVYATDDYSIRRHIKLLNAEMRQQAARLDQHPSRLAMMPILITAVR